MKTYKRSDKCEIVHTPVSWNIIDDEQRKDFEWISKSPNRGGRIKECVRAMRLRQLTIDDVPYDNVELYGEDEVSDADVLRSLTE